MLLDRNPAAPGKRAQGRAHIVSKVLVVDDEPNMRHILALHLRHGRHEIIEAAGVEEARRAIGQETLDAVIADQKMKDGDGLEVLAFARNVDPTLSVVFLTAFATIELAVESMRRGAFDFITKPFVPEVVLAATQRAIERTQLLRENGRLRDAVIRLEGSAEIVGRSAAIREMRKRIARVAPTNATVLITGETGSGKELVARSIHQSSPLASKPFIAVNCAAFPDTLLESELFGHERGAFTGADRAREGLFEAANDGTLFLDEAGDMSIAAQSRLLRVLSDGLVTRLGSTKPRRVNVRLLVATNRDLERRVREGLFREDLYYRIAVVPLAVPPLRERREDIPQLCQLFLAQASRDLKIPLRTVSDDAIKLLLGYNFPGNVRELKNLIERACILSTGGEIVANNFPVTLAKRIDAADLTDAKSQMELEELARMLPESLDLRHFLASLEKALILRSLRAARWVQAEAARRLGLTRSDLSYKLDKHGLKNST
jgi:two-component system response regulator HydG